MYFRLEHNVVNKSKREGARTQVHKEISIQYSWEIGRAQAANLSSCLLKGYRYRIDDWDFCMMVSFNLERDCQILDFQLSYCHQVE